MRKINLILIFLVFFFAVISCSSNKVTSTDNNDTPPGDVTNGDPSGGGGSGNGNPPPNHPVNDTSGVKGTWDIPKSEVISGCLGRDCIPSIQHPKFIGIEEVTFLQEDDLVYGVVRNGEARAYAMRILDWHEVVNDEFDIKMAVTYCPLTGSGIALDTGLTGLESTRSLVDFGVSGLLYNNNLILYDRGTESSWVQMQLKSVNGLVRGSPMVTIQLLETTWASWKRMFPDSKILSDETGFDRPYQVFPYGNYKTDPFLLFPISIDDTRLDRKERLHGIITDIDQLRAKTYQFTLFETPRAINDEVDGLSVVVVGSMPDQIYLSYLRNAADGTVLTFQIKTENPAIYPFDLVDNEGTVWNLLGKAISGPRTGEQLKSTDSYNAYWFAWGTLFPGVPIY